MGIFTDLVTGSIVTNIQYVSIGLSHFIIELGHNFVVYITSHPSILGSIPIDSHVLYLHFVLLGQTPRGFSFAYHSQFSMVRPIHVCYQKQSKSVFTFGRACRLVTIKTISSMGKTLVEQGCFITIVNVIWGIP